MSKHHVTITLGRAGQVVRRGGEEGDDGRHDDRTLSGSKRSTIRERLGSNEGSSSMFANKRHRGDGNGWSPGSNGVDGARVGQNDLRLKLMHKKLSKRMQGGDASQRRDLREKLSRTVGSPVRDELPHRSEQREQRERREHRVLRQAPSIRNEENMVQGESLRRSYSSIPMDSFRSRSPERSLHNYRGVSPPRNMDELRRIPMRRPFEASRNSPPRNVNEMRQVPTRRTIDDSRNRLLSGNGVYEPSGPMGTSSFTKQPSLGMSKSLPRMPPPVPPPSNGTVPRSIYMGENIAELLQTLGLGKYYINFQAEEVDMTALRQMGDIDLKEMGIPMGPRKKILLALMPRSKRPPP